MVETSEISFDLDSFLDNISVSSKDGDRRFERVSRNIKLAKEMISKSSHLGKTKYINKWKLIDTESELSRLSESHSNLLKEHIPLMQKYEEAQLELTHLRAAHSQLQTEVEALGLHSKQLQALVKKLEENIESKIVENALLSTSTTTSKVTSKHLKHIILFGKIAAKKGKLNNKHKTLLNKYLQEVGEKDEVIDSDDNDLNNIEMPPSCDSVDTGIGSSHTSDDEKIRSPNCQPTKPPTHELYALNLNNTSDASALLNLNDACDAEAETVIEDMFQLGTRNSTLLTQDKTGIVQNELLPSLLESSPKVAVRFSPRKKHTATSPHKIWPESIFKDRTKILNSVGTNTHHANIMHNIATSPIKLAHTIANTSSRNNKASNIVKNIEFVDECDLEIDNILREMSVDCIEHISPLPPTPINVRLALREKVCSTKRRSWKRVKQSSIFNIMGEVRKLQVTNYRLNKEIYRQRKQMFNANKILLSSLKVSDSSTNMEESGLVKLVKYMAVHKRETKGKNKRTICRRKSSCTVKNEIGTSPIKKTPQKVVKLPAKKSLEEASTNLQSKSFQNENNWRESIGSNEPISINQQAPKPKDASLKAVNKSTLIDSENHTESNMLSEIDKKNSLPREERNRKKSVSNQQDKGENKELVDQSEAGNEIPLSLFTDIALDRPLTRRLKSSALFTEVFKCPNETNTKDNSVVNCKEIKKKKETVNQDSTCSLKEREIDSAKQKSIEIWKKIKINSSKELLETNNPPIERDVGFIRKSKLVSLSSRISRKHKSDSSLVTENGDENKYSLCHDNNKLENSDSDLTSYLPVAKKRMQHQKKDVNAFKSSMNGVEVHGQLADSEKDNKIIEYTDNKAHIKNSQKVDLSKSQNENKKRHTESVQENTSAEYTDTKAHIKNSQKVDLFKSQNENKKRLTESVQENTSAENTENKALIKNSKKKVDLFKSQNKNKKRHAESVQENTSAEYTDNKDHIKNSQKELDLFKSQNENKKRHIQSIQENTSAQYTDTKAHIKNSQKKDLSKSQNEIKKRYVESVQENTFANSASQMNSESENNLSHCIAENINSEFEKRCTLPINLEKNNNITEFAANNETGDSIFFKNMLTKYGKHIKRTTSLKLSESSIKTIEIRIEKCLGSLLELPTVQDLDDFIGGLEMESPKVFVAALLEFLMSDSRNKDILCKKTCVQIPSMTKPEQALLYILTSLEKKWPNIGVFQEVMKSIEYKLLRLGFSPSITQVENLSRFYAVLCRFRHSKEVLRMFMVEALYCLNYKALPLIKQCLDVWMHVLPLAHLSQAKSPIVIVLIYVIFYFRVDDCKSSLIVDRLKNILSNKYSYKMKDVTETDILSMLKAHVLDSRVIASERRALASAFILIAKRKGAKWCQKNIVEGLLMPLVNDANTKECVRVFCISLLGSLLKPYPDHMKLHCEMIMNKLLVQMEENPSSAIEQAILYSLLLLRRHNLNRIHRILLTWVPRGEVSPDLKEQIKIIIQESPLKSWLGMLRHKSDSSIF